MEGLIKAFFGGNAALTIIIVLLIIIFLLREGLGFFPAYRNDLQLYRKSGMEFVDLARKDLTSHEQMVSLLNRSYYAQVNAGCRTEMKRSEEAGALVTFVTEAVAPPQTKLIELTTNAGENAPPKELVDKLTERYHELLHSVISGKSERKLPPTPHLTTEERKLLIQQLNERAPTSTDDPAFLNTLREELAVRQAASAEPFTEFRNSIDAFSSSSEALGTFVADATTTAKGIKDAADLHEAELKKRETLQEAAAAAKNPEEKQKLTEEANAAVTTGTVDFSTARQPLVGKLEEVRSANQAVVAGLDTLLPQLPVKLEDDKAERYLAAFRKASNELKKEFADTLPKMQAWNGEAPVSLFAALKSFLTGRDWITGGEWQDFYGIMPLFVGSLMISMIALVLAVPFGVGAAIYVNQLAGPRQQRFIKPTIEFIQAIPSVVLGFIGIAVVGTLLRDASTKDALSWIPGFPIQERLNMFTAGCLLGLMAIPTIFSLAEDALNNVPASFAEASDALGASRLQTIFRVVVPAAISGILAAVLLGLGRVIGETMVVLLVAGNRIQIPDFTEGLGTIFQPAHTLTGIIAQELGEVPFGSVHYRALFVVGAVLFVIVLSINGTAQHLFRKFRVGQH